MFDPNGWNTNGMCFSDGTAVVPYHKGLKGIVAFYKDLTKSIDLTEYLSNCVLGEFQLKHTSSDSNKRGF